MRVFVDLDGVLVNFNKTFAPAYGLIYPDNQILGKRWIFNNSEMSLRQWLEVMRLNTHRYENAEPVKYLADLISILDDVAPGWSILSEVLNFPDCWSGKIHWVQKYLGRDMVQRTILTGCSASEYGTKAVLCASGDVLIDDCQITIDKWRLKQGVGFFWTEYTNVFESKAVHNQLHTLREFLKLYVAKPRPGKSKQALTSGWKPVG